MSNADKQLDECGCCEGVKRLTPASIENPPGLTALAYRAGTHGSFKSTMQGALSGQAPLRELTTRDDDDPAIALLDGWATVLDVLSFYQERIADEGYLRTATERGSILEMARSIGYELRPGVAAGTFLAFTLETAESAPRSARIPVGSKAQSTPAQDETPQVFETVEEIKAFGVWNALKPKQTELAPPKRGMEKIYLKGVSTNLKPGDALLIIGDERLDDPGNENWDFRRVRTSTPVTQPDAESSYTEVILDKPLGSDAPAVEPARKNPRVYALRQRAALFGYNAPDWRAMPEALKRQYVPSPAGLPNDWPNFNIAYATVIPPSLDVVFLDAVYPQIIANGWVVLSGPESSEVYQVDGAVEASRTEFTLTAKTTRLKLKGELLSAQFGGKLRETVVFAQSEELTWAERPIAGPVKGNEVVLAAKVDDLFSGKLVAISGIDSGTGKPAAEIAVIDRIGPPGNDTQLFLKAPLEHSYRRDSVAINANVARATHGDTKEEVLGSGDGSTPFQKFALKQKPLTFVSAPTAGGAQTTLAIRVDDVLWKETPGFYRLAQTARAYTTRIADDGKVTVQFGDGVTGARVRTGSENISAKYRVGIGLSGMLAPAQINLLMSRPLGVNGVINPLAPTGAEDPENRDQARQNAPLTVLTLDRIVSLQDFEDFTRAFAGIGKAQATWLWDGEKRLIHLTVAGVNGVDVPSTSDVYLNLVAAIDGARHVDQRVTIDPYKPVLFNVEAKLLIDPDYVFDHVRTAVEKALIEEFAFAKRPFGQAVTASEVIAIAQRVKGVVAVDLDRLYFDGASAALQQRLPANIARWVVNVIKPAELLTVNAAGIKLTEMTL